MSIIAASLPKRKKFDGLSPNPENLIEHPLLEYIPDDKWNTSDESETQNFNLGITFFL